MQALFRDAIKLFCFCRSPCRLFRPEHKSNPRAQYEMILREGKKFVLNIGAGATTIRYANCIEFEHKIFRHTDVVGDAHCLPFRNEIFDCVFGFNVFEHLENPRRVAAEILRVLNTAVHCSFTQLSYNRSTKRHFIFITRRNMVCALGSKSSRWKNAT